MEECGRLKWSGYRGVRVGRCGFVLYGGGVVRALGCETRLVYILVSNAARKQVL